MVVVYETREDSKSQITFVFFTCIHFNDKEVNALFHIVTFFVLNYFKQCVVADANTRSVN